MMTAGLVGELVAGWLSDKLHKRVIFLALSTGVATPALLLLNYSLELWALILVLLVIGFFFYLGVPPTTAYLTEVSPRENRGLAFGLLFSIGALPGAISPIIFGWIGDLYGLSASVLFLVSTTILSTLLALIMKDVKTNERVEAKPECLDSPTFE
jgi:MFS family permease